MVRIRKNKLYIKILCVVLCIICMVVYVPNIETRATLSDITSDSIKDKENQIANSQKETESLKSSVTDLKKLLKELESDKNKLNNYVKKLDGNLADINDKIEELSVLIEEKQADIDEAKKELDLATKVEKEQYDQMQQRIQFIYERGEYAVVDLVFKSTGLSDILNKMEYVEMLSKYDRETLNSYIHTRETIASIKALLESEEEYLEEARKLQEEEQSTMETLIIEKNNQIHKYESDIANKEQAKKEIEEEIRAEERIIQALELAIAEERRQIAEENGLLPSYDGGKFAWPAPSYTRISSDYGMRYHPILHTNKMHNGVDMAAPGGSPILAAYDGKVIDAGYSSSMGNYVWIDHGDNVLTVYMHASKLRTSKGAIVSRGERIADVGTTGRSTANHLHFGVRKNGVYVSPWNYLK